MPSKTILRMREDRARQERRTTAPPQLSSIRPLGGGPFPKKGGPAGADLSLGERRRRSRGAVKPPETKSVAHKPGEYVPPLGKKRSGWAAWRAKQRRIGEGMLVAYNHATRKGKAHA